ncbi:MAG: glutathione peroxidase [Oscillospiraceae bacterium]|jgi:glutathione peroxidase|nr:glutathione peroxidase [Oscillospiraceae bacterium]
MSVYDYSYTSMEGTAVPLTEYAGQVILIVNTASKCGFTPQYEGLEQLWKTYRDRGLVVIGFPCNQFLHQDPGDNAQIQEFCTVRYGVSFPLSQKIDVKGANAHPLFAELSRGKSPKWNFTKFLIGRDGELSERFSSVTKPEQLAPYIERLL